MHRSLLWQALRVREVFDFVQGDLRHHKAMMLDNYNEVFLWIGPQCNAIVQRMSLSLAQVAATDMHVSMIPYPLPRLRSSDALGCCGD